MDQLSKKTQPKTHLNKGLQENIKKSGALPEDFAMVNIAVRYDQMRCFIAHLRMINIDVELPPKVEALVKFYENKGKSE